MTSSRAARKTDLRNGLKLHFGNSVVDYHDPQHIEQVKRVFRAANGYRMPIVVHMRASFTAKLPYGRDEAPSSSTSSFRPRPTS